MTHDHGFTLIEILLTVTIFGVIVNLSSGVDLGSLEKNSLAGEQTLIVSIVERARSHDQLRQPKSWILLYSAKLYYFYR
jgi:prepilin-type N-terminal cleavage/methylation domain-containing protein